MNHNRALHGNIVLLNIVVSTGAYGSLRVCFELPLCYKHEMPVPEGVSPITTTDDRTACLVISGLIHGNEPVGGAAIAKTEAHVNSGEWKIAGTVFGLIGNPRAAQINERFVDENLNRAFGRSEPTESYEASRAQEIDAWFQNLTETFKDIYLLDLHSVSLGETRIAIFNADNPRSSAWAELVSPIPFRLAFREEVLPGSLIGALEKRGGIAVTIECGNHASTSGTTVALEHIERALRSLQFLKEATASYLNNSAYEGPRRTYTLLAPIKPARGFTFTLPVNSEMLLHEGVVYATDESGEHRAPCDCYVMMPSKNPQPDDFDAGFLATKKDA